MTKPTVARSWRRYVPLNILFGRFAGQNQA
jgi:hypothetical protein